MSLRILVNQVGYDPHAPKHGVVRAESAVRCDRFELRRGGQVAFHGPVHHDGPVDRWRNWDFSSFDFSRCSEAGSYTIAVRADGEWFEVDGVRIEPWCWARRTLHDVVEYFRSQRSAGKVDDADRGVPFFGGRPGRVDAHGGWYDASGDVSKYLSHLSYANFMNPQQSPFVVWALLESAARLEAAGYPDEDLQRKLRAEAAHGADFLVRMQDPADYFYMTVFDQWSKDVSQREICAYKTQKGIKLDSYEAGYRQGGGLAIAALARAAATRLEGCFAVDRYLEAAESGFMHLEARNLEYLDDGKENIIDDYAALMAASELYRATGKPTGKQSYLNAARRRAERLMARCQTTAPRRGLLWANDERTRPFFHAVEAGMPGVALLNWRALEPDDAFRRDIDATVRSLLGFELDITFEVTNPFVYPRQYVKPLNGPAQSAFFFPHENESGYWWQGENARLGSLAALAGTCLSLPWAAFDEEPGLRERVRRYAHAPIDWILGQNPFDSCMLFGLGRNNLDYEPPLFGNAPGGICNGVTAGFSDESDIEFGIPGIGGEHSWRWGEQWLPHAAWYLLAVAALSHPSCH